MSRKRIGLLVPSTNTTSEADFWMAAPRGVTVHSHRMLFKGRSESGATLEEMNAEIAHGAKCLATARVAGIAYCCTSGSFFKGQGYDLEMQQRIREIAGVPGVATSPSVVEALRYLGAKRVSVATPYPEFNNEKLRRYLEAAGFEVLNVEGDPRVAVNAPGPTNDAEPADIVEFASKVCRPEAEALVCGCTAWRSMEAAEELERRLGRPVVTANQATVWATFRAVGITQPVQGFGRLLRELAAVAR